MKSIKGSLVVLVILVIILFLVIFFFRNDEEEIFSISDELLSYGDEVKEDKINSIFIFYMVEDEKTRELHLGKQNDEAAMEKLVEELHGIEVTKLNKDEMKELKEYINQWDNKGGNDSFKEKEIISQINPSDTSNWTGSTRVQDKIADRIYIFSTGEIVFKMPEQESGRLTPDEVFYRSKETESGKCERIMELIESAYSRRNPEIKE